MSAAATPAADLQRDTLLWIVPPAAIAVALLLCIVMTLVAVWIKRRNAASKRRKYQVREAALAEIPPAPTSTGVTATDDNDVTQYADINMALLVRRQEPPAAAAETNDDDQNHNLTYAQLSFNAGGV